MSIIIKELLDRFNVKSEIVHDSESSSFFLRIKNQ